jgi:multidrug resistance efflux pump
MAGSVIVIVVLALIGSVVFLGGGAKEGVEQARTDARSVELIDVALYRVDAESSVARAGVETVLRAEKAGKIAHVLPIGTRVSLGATVAEFENSSERAALLQAEGALEAAEASLEKTRGGTRSEQIAVLEAAFESAKSGAVATLLSAYGAVDSAIRDAADQMISNPTSEARYLIFSSSSTQRRVNITNTRATLSIVLARQRGASASLSTASDLGTELATTEEEVRRVRAFMDELIAALNEAFPAESITAADIAAYKVGATSARTALTTALSSIASSRGALETAQHNLEEGVTGAQAADVSAAEASVKQAQGAYNAALATYQKSIVRTNVSGTIVACGASVGNVVSVGADVCRIRTSGVVSGDAFALPLSSVKYTPTGAFVFVVSEDGVLEAIEISTGLVTANGIAAQGLSGDEHIVRDVRGLKTGERVTVVPR